MPKYNGYANRTTWAVALYINNDQGLSAIFENMGADYIKETWEQWTDEFINNPDQITRDMRAMLWDVGDTNEVDWDEIEEACRCED